MSLAVEHTLRYICWLRSDVMINRTAFAIAPIERTQIEQNILLLLYAVVERPDKHCGDDLVESFHQ